MKIIVRRLGESPAKLTSTFEAAPFAIHHHKDGLAWFRITHDNSLMITLNKGAYIKQTHNSLTIYGSEAN